MTVADAASSSSTSESRRSGSPVRLQTLCATMRKTRKRMARRVEEWEEEAAADAANAEEEERARKMKWVRFGEVWAESNN